MRRNKHYLLIFAFCSMTLNVIKGQYDHIVFRHITPASGLPVKNITSIVQDKHGFIWLGSTEGLFRFDGFNYKTFSAVPGNPETLPSDIIHKLYFDREGFLWVGTDRAGLVKMSISGRVLKVFNSFTNPLFTNLADRIRDIREDKNGNLWVSTADGLFRINKKEEQVQRIAMEQSRKHNCISNFFGLMNFDEQGRLWVGTRKGVHIYDPLADEFQHCLNNPQNLPLLHYNNSAIIFYDTQRKLVWCSTYEPSLKLFDLRTGDSTVFYNGNWQGKMNDDWVARDFYEDGSGRLWITTARGAYLTTPDRKGLEYLFQHNAADVGSLIDNIVNGVLKDREGTTWFATNDGISYAQIKQLPFSNYLKNQKKDYSFADKVINNVIAADSNTYLVNAYAPDGVYETDSSFRVRKQHILKPGVQSWIWAACKDKFTGEIYLAAQNSMLKFLPSKQELVRMRSAAFDTGSAFSSVFQHDDGWIWYSNYRNNFYRYHPVNGQYKMYRLKDLGEKEQILWLEKASNGDVWIVANNTGILRFDTKLEKIVQRILFQEDTAKGLLQSEVDLIKELPGKLITGHDADGIRIYDKRTGGHEHFSKINGMISSQVRDLLIHPNGQVWVATGNGLSCFDTLSRQFRNFSATDGVGNTDIISLSLLPRGKIAAGTSSGLIVFHPDQLETHKKPEAPIITGLNIYGKSEDPDSLFLTKKPVDISYRKNYFSIEYISPQYMHNQEVEYAYQLTGFDKEWIAAGNRRYASYSNLPGGRYLFRVRCRYPGEDWVEIKLGMAFIMHSAFYSQWWFFIICGLIVIATLYILYRYRLKQIMQVEQIRSSISSDLHDEVGATLSSISMFSQMVKSMLKKQPDRSEELLDRIGSRSRDMVESMSDIVWSINPKNDSMDKMILRMRSFAIETFEARDISMNWENGQEFNNLKLDMVQRKNFYLIFKEAVNNAAKYADARRVNIRIFQQNGRLHIKIQDDGKGFDLNKIKEGNGNGINNMQHRAMILNGKLQIESEKEEGTTISLDFPL